MRSTIRRSSIVPPRYTARNGTTARRATAWSSIRSSSRSGPPYQVAPELTRRSQVAAGSQRSSRITGAASIGPMNSACNTPVTDASGLIKKIRSSEPRPAAAM